MKQGANQLLGIKIKDGLTNVEKILFKFSQNGKTLTFTYPSTKATVDTTDANVINLYWTYADTFLFDAGKMYLDTLIKYTGANSTPISDIKEIEMSPTLFRQEEVKTFYD